MVKAGIVYLSFVKLLLRKHRSLIMAFDADKFNEIGDDIQGAIDCLNERKGNYLDEGLVIVTVALKDLHKLIGEMPGIERKI